MTREPGVTSRSVPLDRTATCMTASPGIRCPGSELTRPAPRSALELRGDVALGLVVGVGSSRQQLGDALEGLLTLRPALVELFVVAVEGARTLARPASGELTDFAHHPLELLRDVAGGTAHVPGGAAKFAGGDGEATAHAGLLLSWRPMTEHPDGGRSYRTGRLTGTCVFGGSSLPCPRPARSRRGAPMPTLEDTVDFKVVTLNDLVDADVRTGVPVAAAGKYKRWAFLSTGVAGMLLIALIVALVTGGGSEGGGAKASKEFPAPANTGPVDVPVGPSVPSGIALGGLASINDIDGQVIVSGATVTQIKEAPAVYGKGKSYTVVVAVSNDDLAAVTTAKSKGKLGLQAGKVAKATTTTSAPAATAPVPIQPAPATTTPSH